MTRTATACKALQDSGFDTLPALKGLSKLADVRPVVVVDNREQTPLTFTRLEAVTGTLQSGDYSVKGCEHTFTIERKSIADLTACCASGRPRFERELHRLRGYRFARLLIVGSEEAIRAHEYKSRIEPRAVLHSLWAWEVRFDLPVVFEPTPEAAALRVESWVFWYAREQVQTCNELLRGHNIKERQGR